MLDDKAEMRDLLIHHIGYEPRLEHGKSAAKTEDNHTCKRWVSSWRAWNPPLKRLKKIDRGLAHEECAKLLCPITVDWADEM